jgi:gluconate 2-dehydrogenase gamma chain
MQIDRRQLLTGTAMALLAAMSRGAMARIVSGGLPWAPDAGVPPMPVSPGGWQFFTPEEGATVEALVNRLIPPDPQTPGGKDAGCAVYVDRQLAGPYGRQDGNYNLPPFQKGSKTQGPQSEDGPAQKYRTALAALDDYCKSKHGGKVFADLSDDDKDEVLKGLEAGKLELGAVDGKGFFEQVLKDIQTGFFADPLYGGNRDMVAWKMIGYPGARYNYLDWIDRHNERFPLPPVGITGRAEWTPKG